MIVFVNEAGRVEFDDDTGLPYEDLKFIGAEHKNIYDALADFKVSSDYILNRITVLDIKEDGTRVVLGSFIPKQECLGVS